MTNIWFGRKAAKLPIYPTDVRLHRLALVAFILYSGGVEKFHLPAARRLINISLNPSGNPPPPPHPYTCTSCLYYSANLSTTTAVQYRMRFLTSVLTYPSCMTCFRNQPFICILCIFGSICPRFYDVWNRKCAKNTQKKLRLGSREPSCKLRL
jgi:hypothetical protein